MGKDATMGHTDEVGRSQPDELRRYISPYARWSWLLLLCVLIGMVGTFIVTKLQPPVYRATTVLIVDAETAPAPDEGTQLATTYAQLVTRPIVLQGAARLAGHVSARSLAERVQSTVESNTALIDIAVDDTSPSRAALQANAVASAFTSVLVQQGLGTRYPVSVFQQAVAPATPDHPNPIRNAVIAGVLAFVLAVALIHLLDALDAQPTMAAKPNEQVDLGAGDRVPQEGIDLESTDLVDMSPHSAESLPLGGGA